MKTRLIILALVVLVATNTFAKTAERKVARVEVTEYRNGQQTSSFSYKPQSVQLYNKYPGQPLSFSGYTGPGSNIISYPVDPSRVVVDANGVQHIIDRDGDPRGPDNIWGFVKLLLILAPFAIIALVPTYSDKVIFFENAGEVALNCVSAVGLVLFLTFFPTYIKDIGVILFWVFTGVLVTVNVARSYSSNPGSPILATIVGLGKAPAAIITAFFTYTNAFGKHAIKRDGEDGAAFAARDLGLKMQGWVTAAGLVMFLRSLINGDRVRARRCGYNPYSKEYEGEYGYN